MSHLRIGWVQMDIVWEQPEANISRFHQLIEGQAADVWVLPEMWSTGFTMNVATAEKEWGPTWEAMRYQAAQLQALLMGSVQVRVDGTMRNRLYAIFPDGETMIYDKKHLFRMSGEHLSYLAGEKRLVVEWKGWRIAPLICYDLRFPVWSRRTPSYDYDLLIYVANWPQVRHSHWLALLPARAIENQAFVLGVNRIGQDGNGHTYAGGSQLIAPTGEVLLHSGIAEGCFVAEIDRIAMQTYRERFPAWQDADAFTLLPMTAWG